MATAIRDIERTYDPAAAGAAVSDAVRSMTGVAGVAAVAQQTGQTLDALYYDTADLRLLRAGITLRRRAGGEDAGWCLKLPGCSGGDEILRPLGSRARAPEARAPEARTLASGQAGQPAVPKELAALVRAWARGEGLEPVLHLRTTRGLLRLLDGAGRPLAEVMSDHVSAEPAGGSAATSWDEIEAALVNGHRGLLKAIDTRLRQAGARRVATTGLERTLGSMLPAAEAPGVPALTERSPAGEVVLAYVRQQVLAILRCDPLVRRDEPDAVHQMRVATRRARSALQAFGQIVGREATRPLCDELKWLAATLGHARDAEVLLARLTAELAAIPAALVVGPVKARITGHFSAELAQAGKAALRALNGRRYLRLLDDLDRLLADPPLTPRAQRRAGTALAKPVRRAARRLQRALAAVPGAEDQDAAIHEARKAGKRARYAAEVALPALGGKARRQAARTKKLQEVLGDHQDSVVARAVLREIADEARSAGEDTFSYGLVYGREACQAAEIERALPRLAARAR